MIRFIAEDAAMLEALESPRRFLERYGADVSGHLEPAREIVNQTLAFQRRIGASFPWIGYLSVSTATNQVVGGGGFKGNPGADHTVEIAYFTFPPHRKQGFGTATAAKLVEIAAESADVEAVIAHTLPENNASTKILEKVGFENAGEAIDPEDGRVWRWTRPAGPREEWR